MSQKTRRIRAAILTADLLTTDHTDRTDKLQVDRWRPVPRQNEISHFEQDFRLVTTSTKTGRSPFIEVQFIRGIRAIRGQKFPGRTIRLTEPAPVMPKITRSAVAGLGAAGVVRRHLVYCVFLASSAPMTGYFCAAVWMR